MLNNYLQADEIPADQQPGRGKLVGQKPPLKPKEVWSIRALLQLNENAIWGCLSWPLTASSEAVN